MFLTQGYASQNDDINNSKNNLIIQKYNYLIKIKLIF